MNKPRGGFYRKASQQVGAVGLLTAIETQVSHCDLSALCFVVMANLRGALDGRALAQRAARGSSWQTFAWRGHFPPTLLLWRGRGGLLYFLIQG